MIFYNQIITKAIIPVGLKAFRWKLRFLKSYHCDKHLIRQYYEYLFFFVTNLLTGNNSIGELNLLGCAFLYCILSVYLCSPSSWIPDNSWDSHRALKKRIYYFTNVWYVAVGSKHNENGPKAKYLHNVTECLPLILRSDFSEC